MGNHLGWASEETTPWRAVIQRFGRMVRFRTLSTFDDAVPADAEAWARYTRDLAAVYVYVALVIMLVAVLLWWPVDYLVAPNPKYLEVFADMRMVMLGETCLSFGLIAYSPYVRRNILWAAPIVYTVMVTTIGYQLGRLGAAEGIVWLANAQIALVTLAPLPMTGGGRAAALLSTFAGLFFGFFVLHPENRASEYLWAQVTFGFFVIGFSFAIGWLFFQTLQAGHSSMRSAMRARVEIAALNTSLADRVEAQTQEIQTLAAQAERAHEIERRRLSRELHDELGQDLTAMRYTLALVERWHTQHPSGLGPLLGQLSALLNRTTETTRSIISGLRPAVVDDLGLEPAIHWLAEQLRQNAGVPVDVSMVQGLDIHVDRDARVAIFRMIQESTTNALKHGSPSRLEVSVRLAGVDVEVEVVDDGDGFQPDQRDGGMGLIGMRERMRAFGGTLCVESRKGEGTRVIARIPRSTSHGDGTTSDNSDGSLLA